MVSSGARNGKYIQGLSHMDISGVRRIALVQIFIDFKLLPMGTKEQNAFWEVSDAKTCD